MTELTPPRSTPSDPEFPPQPRHEPEPDPGPAQDAWNSWSAVEQDLSLAESTSHVTYLLEAFESSAQQVARLQMLAARSLCASLEANPFLPPPAQMMLVTQLCQPLESVSEWQRHLVATWFGLARALVVASPRVARHEAGAATRALRG